MTVKTEPVRKAVARVSEEIREKAWTVGRDRRAEQKKRLAWTALTGGLGALATLGARRLASKTWRAATGEEPPAKK